MSSRFRSIRNPKVYVAFVIAFLLVLFFYPMKLRFKYEYQRGRPWMYETLISPIDFPILKTEAELLEEVNEAAQHVLPVFRYDQGIARDQMKNLNRWMDSTRLDASWINAINQAVGHIYDRGVIPSLDLEMDYPTIVVLRDRSFTEVPYAEVYNEKTVPMFLRFALADLHNTDQVDSLISELSSQRLIQSNLIYDQKRTDQLHKEAVNYISPTKGICYIGQLIVTEGETVTPQIEQLLDSYKAEYEQSIGYSGERWVLWVGHSAILLIILFLLFIAMFYAEKDMFQNRNNVHFILLLFVLSFLATIFALERTIYTPYLIPYTVFALYLVSFYPAGFAFRIYSILILPLLILPAQGLELYVANLLSGAIGILCFRHFNGGWLQFLNATFAVLGLIVSYLSFRLIMEGSLDTVSYEIILFSVLNGFLIVAAYPVVYLFEKIFGFISDATLKELTNTNSKLLLELSRKAPGTFQHCLQVANLSEAAVRQIGGNVFLVRAGALYHDIGKINNPQCFIENQASNIQYHANLTPMESAKQIIRHVDDGMEIARKYKLPKEVTMFIQTHHAKTLTAYFYNTYCNQGGDPENKAAFMYHGELPKTREQVIVLMADAVEAASRSLKDYSLESISQLVEKIIGERLSDTQLLDANISIRDINTVKAIFIQQLSQIYHARISYPERK